MKVELYLGSLGSCTGQKTDKFNPRFGNPCDYEFMSIRRRTGDDIKRANFLNSD